MHTAFLATLLLGLGALLFFACLAVRRMFPRVVEFDTAPWVAGLSYIATAYGVIIGFSIIFLFGEFSEARDAIGHEATSIQTIFEEVRMFPEHAPDVQHALICYSRAVPEYDWPALRESALAPEVDVAFRGIIDALSESGDTLDETFEAAAATNIFVQVGSMSTAREARFVAAEVQMPALLWGLLLGGGAFVVGVLFVVTLHAHSVAQATLVATSGIFTAVMIFIVLALSSPFSGGSGSLTPVPIERTTEYMESASPEAAARPCDLGPGD